MRNEHDITVLAIRSDELSDQLGEIRDVARDESPAGTGGVHLGDSRREILVARAPPPLRGSYGGLAVTVWSWTPYLLQALAEEAAGNESDLVFVGA